MSSIVVDASVAVKWFVPEVHSGPAATWLGRGYDLLAPDLIFSEVGNIVWKKVSRGELAKDEGRMVLRGFESVPFAACSTRKLLPLAFEIALGLKRTAYDGMYLALAVAEDSLFVTADRKLYGVVASSVLREQICWVEDVGRAP